MRGRVRPDLARLVGLEYYGAIQGEPSSSAASCMCGHTRASILLLVHVLPTVASPVSMRLT